MLQEGALLGDYLNFQKEPSFRRVFAGLFRFPDDSKKIWIDAKVGASGQFLSTICNNEPFDACRNVTGWGLFQIPPIALSGYFSTGPLIISKSAGYVEISVGLGV